MNWHLYIIYYHRQFYKTVFSIEIFVPLPIFLCVWKVILVLVRFDATPTQRYKYLKKAIVKCVIVLVWQQISPILILLFTHTRRLEGVRKFVWESPSYISIYGYYHDAATFVSLQIELVGKVTKFKPKIWKHRKYVHQNFFL
jgi:hypothetical protein